MNLPPRTLALKILTVKDRPVLALDTGFDADSIEGLRLVKASRGSGWLFHAGTLVPWVTKGVLQDDQKLVVWGDCDLLPPGSTPEAWPRSGEEGRVFLQALVAAWTTRAAQPEPLEAFSPSSLVPWKTESGWSFVFLPPELRGVLDSLQPLGDRLAWEHVRHPDATGASSWAFASAAFAWDLVAGSLPWAQDDEAHLRQEIRELKKTLVPAELPEGPDPETLSLWFDSLTGRLGSAAAARWQTWASGRPSWTAAPSDPQRAQKRELATARRLRRRSGAAFWRQKGTLTTVMAALGVLVLAIVGTVVWGIVKPDPTDTWTPEQVVRGYYEALSSLDADQMRKLTAFDEGREQELRRDEDETTNLYVIRQVRTAYEKASPVLSAQEWEAAGRPPLENTRILYGIAGLEVTGQDTQWKARYRKWISEAEEDAAPVAVGFEVSDVLTLVETGKGWKVAGLQRQRQPLP